MKQPRKHQKEKSASRLEKGALGQYFEATGYISHYRPVSTVLYDHRGEELTHTEVRSLSGMSNGKTGYALLLGTNAGVVRRKGTRHRPTYSITSYGRRIMDYLLAFKDKD